MVDRQFWHERIETAWKRRSIVWLSGVRRVGKTCLCQTLLDIEYFDCELPRVRRLMEDPQAFLDSVGNGRIVLDESPPIAEPIRTVEDCRGPLSADSSCRDRFINARCKCQISGYTRWTQNRIVADTPHKDRPQRLQPSGYSPPPFTRWDYRRFFFRPNSRNPTSKSG